MDPQALTIGFARRATGYKRATLIFSDLHRLTDINRKEKIQMIFAGKAHPNDTDGKRLIRQIHDYANTLKDQISIVYLENYNMDIAAKLTSGVDVWLNTPLPPFEASGTSGMKAAHNGVVNFSVLDGWWMEGCIEGVTGWAIGPHPRELLVDSERREARTPRPLQQTRIPNPSNILQAKRRLDNSNEKLHRKNSLLLPDAMGCTQIHNRSLPNLKNWRYCLALTASSLAHPRISSQSRKS